jgi:dTDP-4-amino-4,6-dideoxygalactose transaminase
VGATPVFIDVVETDHLMNVELLAGAASAGDIDAIVVTHLFGLMHDMAAIRAIADPHGLPVIEDCAQAHGAHRDGRQAGSSGDIACFSFYPTKNLGAIGDGGALLTGDAELAARLRRLRQYGWDSKYQVAFAGGRNSRLDEIQAAVLRSKLLHLRRWNDRRHRIASRYSSDIENPRIVCPLVREEGYVAHLYVVACEDRARLRQHLETAQIGCDIHYPIPDHRQPLMLRSNGSITLPVTERLAERVLTLPCFPELSDAEVDYIVEQVNAWR